MVRKHALASLKSRTSSSTITSNQGFLIENSVPHRRRDPVQAPTDGARAEGGIIIGSAMCTRQPVEDVFVDATRIAENRVLIDC